MKLNKERVEEFQIFFNKIQAISVSCEFGDQLDKILSDKFVSGLTREAVLERLCEEKHDLNSEAYLKLALAKEAAMMTNSESVHKIHIKGYKIQNGHCSKNYTVGFNKPNLKIIRAICAIRLVF